MTKGEILARVDVLLDERGIMLEEVLNATDARKIEIFAWFESMREELKDLGKKMRALEE